MDRENELRAGFAMALHYRFAESDLSFIGDKRQEFEDLAVKVLQKKKLGSTMSTCGDIFARVYGLLRLPPSQYEEAVKLFFEKWEGYYS